MAHDPLTMLDIIRMNNSDALAGIIDDVAETYPEFRLGFARPIKGVHYKTLVRTALPSVGFRAANEGTETTKSTRVNRLVECFIADASWYADTAVADAHEDGAPAACALEAADHVEAEIASMCKQFYYGTSSGATGAASGYPGLADSIDSTMIVDATGTTASTGSSVWAVRFGIKHAAWVHGKNGQWTEGEIGKVLKTIDSKDLWCYAQQLQGWVGVQVGSKYSIGKIKNITADSGKTLTDDLLAQLLEKFPVGARPDYFFMTRRSQRQLQDSRTATNATGAPAPFPVESFGVPIVVTDSLLNTETIA